MRLRLMSNSIFSSQFYAVRPHCGGYSENITNNGFLLKISVKRGTKTINLSNYIIIDCCLGNLPTQIFFVLLIDLQIKPVSQENLPKI